MRTSADTIRSRSPQAPTLSLSVSAQQPNLPRYWNTLTILYTDNLGNRIRNLPPALLLDPRYMVHLQSSKAEMECRPPAQREGRVPKQNIPYMHPMMQYGHQQPAKIRMKKRIPCIGGGEKNVTLVHRNAQQLDRCDPHTESVSPVQYPAVNIPTSVIHYAPSNSYQEEAINLCKIRSSSPHDAAQPTHYKETFVNYPPLPKTSDMVPSHPPVVNMSIPIETESQSAQAINLTTKRSSSPQDQAKPNLLNYTEDLQSLSPVFEKHYKVPYQLPMLSTETKAMDHTLIKTEHSPPTANCKNNTIEAINHYIMTECSSNHPEKNILPSSEKNVLNTPPDYDSNSNPAMQVLAEPAADDDDTSSNASPSVVGNKLQDTINAEPHVHPTQKVIPLSGTEETYDTHDYQNQCITMPKAYVILNRVNVNTHQSPQNTHITDHYQENLKQRVQCRLCTKQTKCIVSHYKVEHPTQEVLVSRLSPADTSNAIAESAVMVVPTDAALCCRFCNFSTYDSFKFHDHTTIHTGEYRFKCSECQFSGPFYRSVTAHVKRNHKACDHKVVVTRQIEDCKVLPGFVCSVCNFVQLSEERLKTHKEMYHVGVAPKEIHQINMISYIPIEEEQPGAPPRRCHLKRACHSQ